jgi:hypothetical protein
MSARLEHNSLARTPRSEGKDRMALALESVAFVAVIVLVASALAFALHTALRPKEMRARSATALRELEPRGGRHRFHVRLLESFVIASALASGTGALLTLTASTRSLPLPIGFGLAALAISLWWAWRRGSLRDVDTEARAGRPEPPL